MNEKPSKLVESLIAVQQELRPAAKDKTNPHFKARYATLESCWESCKDALGKNGFAVINQTQQFEDGEGVKTLSLTTKLLHSSGDELATTLPLLNPQGSMQGMGSALSYARRYNLMGLLQICPGEGEDDDGNATNPRIPTPAPTAVRQSARPEPRNVFQRDSKPTEPQIKRLFAIAHSANWAEVELRSFMQQRFKKISTSELTWLEYDQLCKHISGNPHLDKVNQAQKDIERLSTETFPFEEVPAPWEEKK